MGWEGNGSIVYCIQYKTSSVRTMEKCWKLFINQFITIYFIKTSKLIESVIQIFLIEFIFSPFYSQKRSAQRIRNYSKWHWYAGCVFGSLFGSRMDCYCFGVDWWCSKLRKGFILSRYCIFYMRSVFGFIKFNRIACVNILKFHPIVVISTNGKPIKFHLIFPPTYLFPLFLYLIFKISIIPVCHIGYTICSSCNIAGCIQWHYVFYPTEMGKAIRSKCEFIRN